MSNDSEPLTRERYTVTVRGRVERPKRVPPAVSHNHSVSGDVTSTHVHTFSHDHGAAFYGQEPPPPSGAGFKKVLDAEDTYEAALAAGERVARAAIVLFPDTAFEVSINKTLEVTA